MIKLLNKLLRKVYFPISIKFVTGLIFIVLILIGLSANSNESEFLRYLRNFNLANLIVWSYWWPIIIICAVFFGRIWCMVCPIEPLTSFFAKIGLKKKRPGWVKKGWVITIFYVLVLYVGINGFAIHRNPSAMAIYLLIIMFVSISTGLIFKKNTFCRYICPVGYILGLYSRFSFLGWRVKDYNTCISCKDLSCISKKYFYNNNVKSCGVDLYPAKISDNSQCILCSGCLKTCDKYQSENNAKRPNPGFSVIKFGDGLFKNMKLSLAESLFILVVSGFVIYEIFVEWSVSKSLIMFIPKLFAEKFNISNTILFGLQKSILLYFLLPLLIWTIPYLVIRLKSSVSVKKYMQTSAIIFIPIMAMAHVCKGLIKMISRIPYFEHLSTDISGITTTQLLLDKEINLFKIPEYINNISTVLILIFYLIGIFYSFKVADKTIQSTKIGRGLYLIPTIYGSIFLTMFVLWKLF